MGGQFGEPAVGLGLVRGQQRGRRSGAEAGPAGEREPPQQPAVGLGLVVIAQGQHPVDRVTQAEHLDVGGQLSGPPVVGQRGAA